MGMYSVAVSEAIMRMKARLKCGHSGRDSAKMTENPGSEDLDAYGVSGCVSLGLMAVSVPVPLAGMVVLAPAVRLVTVPLLLTSVLERVAPVPLHAAGLRLQVLTAVVAGAMLCAVFCGMLAGADGPLLVQWL